MQNYVLTAVSGVLGGASRPGCGRCWPRANSGRNGACCATSFEVPPLATLPADEVVALIAPTVTRYLTADASSSAYREL